MHSNNIYIYINSSAGEWSRLLTTLLLIKCLHSAIMDILKCRKALNALFLVTVHLNIRWLADACVFPQVIRGRGESCLIDFTACWWDHSFISLLSIWLDHHKHVRFRGHSLLFSGHKHLILRVWSRMALWPLWPKVLCDS